MGLELLASRRFKRYLRITKAGLIRIDRAAIVAAAKYDGKWVIETNDDTISLDKRRDILLVRPGKVV